MVLAKLMPIANVNMIVFVNYKSVSKFLTTIQLIADWHIFFHNVYKFRTFLLGWEIAESHRLTDSAVLFHKPITTGKTLSRIIDRQCGTSAALNYLN